MSTCSYVNHVQGETWFSRPLIEISLYFFVKIPLINEHLFCKYFVRLSIGNATKDFATYGCCHPCYLCIYFQIVKFQNSGNCPETTLFNIFTSTQLYDLQLNKLFKQNEYTYPSSNHIFTNKGCKTITFYHQKVIIHFVHSIYLTIYPFTCMITTIDSQFYKNLPFS